MEKVIYNLVFNRKKRLNAEGKALIQVEAYLNRQKKYFSTKIYVKPTQWDSKRKAVRNHPNMDELNQYIEDYITYLERIELDMVQSGRPFSLKYLRERGDFESVSSSFVSFMKNEINHSNLRLSTLKNHLSTLQVLCQYQPQVSFDDLTFNFLCGFEHFLLEQKYHRNTIAKHMKHLKRYVNLAINKDLFELQKYPFRKYKIKYMESNKQLKRICRLAEIDKRLSFHMARHTNATLLLYNGANITTVQKLLGHKSVRTTEIYSDIMDMTVIRDLENITLK